MNQIKDARLQLTNQAKTEFKQLNIRQFSRDLLEFNKLMDKAVKNSGEVTMKVKFDEALTQNAKLLQEKYPILRYDRKFIDNQLEIKRKKLPKLVCGITYAVIVGGFLGFEILGSHLLPYKDGPGTIIGANFIAGIALFVETLAFSDTWDIDNIPEKNKTKWKRVWNIFDIINNFKNVDDLRNPVDERGYTYSSSSGSGGSTSYSSSTSYSAPKPLFDPNKDNRLPGSPLGPGFTNSAPGAC